MAALAGGHALPHSPQVTPRIKRPSADAAAAGGAAATRKGASPASSADTSAIAADHGGEPPETPAFAPPPSTAATPDDAHFTQLLEQQFLADLERRAQVRATLLLRRHAHHVLHPPHPSLSPPKP